MREVKQMSGAFEGQPVFNVQISRGHKEPPNYFYSNFTVSKSISKSPRSASTRPVIAATGSASQFDNRKQTHPYAPL